MSLSWFQRKTRLGTLLKSDGDEESVGLALDRLLHGQSVIGKTARTSEIDELRFKDRDLIHVGTLESGQFGVIDVVNCRLNGRVYVRKSIEKSFAWRTRSQCSPQVERDILLRASKSKSEWAPHLLCAYQTPTHLKLVMDYAEGGTLWDVLESSPHDGRIPESDIMWWAPQAISAIHWCHSQGFAHRDIKPHNFVLTSSAHILLIDFGSAAPLLPPAPDGSQLLPKQHCLVPCGTCDYISPEILKAHEEALVALEMEDERELERSHVDLDTHGYGRETDWWSVGAMLYEMAYGFAPFFAQDVRKTYLKIIDHKKSLRFDDTISQPFQDFLRRLLTSAEERLGRRSITQITDHPLLGGINWTDIPQQTAPSGIHLPQFVYADPRPAEPADGSQHDQSHSQGFAFSAFFQSSDTSSPGLAILRSISSPHASKSSDNASASFIGFSWGPTLDAFPPDRPGMITENGGGVPTGMATPRPPRVSPSYLTPSAAYTTPYMTPQWVFSTPTTHRHAFSTPVRPNSGVPTPFQTLQRTSTVRRTAGRRQVSDREAMKQLADCVGMSARKKVLESNRKPRILTSFSRSAGTLKELRFDSLASTDSSPTVSLRVRSMSNAALTETTNSNAAGRARRRSRPEPLQIFVPASSTSEDTESEGPPSPSPTPRPGSAMSMMSRRSGTPTVTSRRSSMGTFSSSSMLLAIPTSATVRSVVPGRVEDTTSHAVPASATGAGRGVVVMSEDDDSASLDHMEERYELLMQHILELERRLGRFPF